MALEPVKIPQNVYVEDRIIGGITLKQVIITTIGGGISYACYAVLNGIIDPLPLPLAIAALIPVLIFAAFAFIKINDLSLMRMCLLLIEQMNKPSTRVWAPRRGITISIRTESDKEKTEQERKTEQKEGQRRLSRIDELSRLLDASVAAEEHAATSRTMNNAAQQEQGQEQEYGGEPTVPRPVNPQRVSVSGTESGKQPIDDMRIRPFTDPASAS